MEERNETRKGNPISRNPEMPAGSGEHSLHRGSLTADESGTSTGKKAEDGASSKKAEKQPARKRKKSGAKNAAGKEASKKTSPETKKNSARERKGARGKAGTAEKAAKRKKELDTGSITEARGISHEERRRKQTVRDLIRLGIVIFILALIALGLFFAYRRTTVRTIHVTGSRVYGEAQLISMSGIRPGKNIFLYSEKALRDDMNAIPDIRTVSVTKKLPDTIEIVVSDITASAAILSANGQYTLISDDGYVLSMGEDNAHGLIEVRGMTGVGFALNTFISRQNRTIRTVGTVALLGAIRESTLSDKVLAIDLSASALVTLELRNGYTVVLGSCADAPGCVPTAALAYERFLPVYPNGGTIQVFPDSSTVDFTPAK